MFSRTNHCSCLHFQLSATIHILPHCDLYPRNDCEEYTCSVIWFIFPSEQVLCYRACWNLKACRNMYLSLWCSSRGIWTYNLTCVTSSLLNDSQSCSHHFLLLEMLISFPMKHEDIHVPYTPFELDTWHCVHSLNALNLPALLYLPLFSSLCLRGWPSPLPLPRQMKALAQ